MHCSLEMQAFEVHQGWFDRSPSDHRKFIRTTIESNKLVVP